MSETIVCVSGYFDPIHPGHIELFERAKAQYPGSRLYVIVNNDEQATLKKGKPFMAAAERLKIVRSLRVVDAAVIAGDKDRTVCETLRQIRPHIFANGGDVTPDSPCPEEPVCREMGTELVYGLGLKIQSSRTLIANAGGAAY